MKLSPQQMVQSGLCIGCGACAAPGTMGWDAFGQLEPPPAPAGERFAALCPFSPVAADEDQIALSRFPAAPRDERLGRHVATLVGSAAEPPFRQRGSSGGMVSWVAAELLRTGQIDGVLHVHPGDGGAPFFGYRISRSVDALLAGARSRYHPVHMADVLDEVRRVPGRYAVVGIPCFIKAVHLARAQEPVLAARLTHTLGLFCGHMKSARFVTSFAWQLGVDLDRVRAVEYRLKDAGRPANLYTAHLTLDDGSTVQKDWPHLADGDWGAGYFMNPACNFCDDVVAETADVSFGDAWVEPYSSDGRGTNVLVVRSSAIARVIAEARAAGRLDLQDVDADFVADTQAAGFRQRREGLAYRLTWPRAGVRPVKRVAPSADLPWRRRMVYRTRAAISRGSHIRAARALREGRPQIYLDWAWAIYRLYEALTYARGPLADRIAGRERRRDQPGAAAPSPQTSAISGVPTSTTSTDSGKPSFQ